MKVHNISIEDIETFLDEEDTTPDGRPLLAVEQQLNASISLKSFTASATARYGKPAAEEDEVPEWMRKLEKELGKIENRGPGWAGRIARREST